jgi:hypothetical protein
MPRKGVRDGLIGWSALGWGLIVPAIADAQSQVHVAAPLVTVAGHGSPQQTPSGNSPLVLASPQDARGCLACAVQGSPQTVPGASSLPMLSIRQLVRMSGPELDQLYMQASAGTIPAGKTRGRAILYPGTRWAVPASRVARVAWQGKVFREDGVSAVNRFFGVRMIRADVAYGPSWLDGRPSIILDYEHSSRLYEPYRDELREVAPGLYLGLMYERTAPQPNLKMYFAIETSS